jgi:hypothetical protein
MSVERNPQRHKKEKLNLGVPLATVGLFVIASLGAFSRKVKYEIHNRDNWTCNRCGTTIPPFEAGHKNHDKKNPNYNHPSNGDTFCVSCHLEDHIENAGKNGLSKKANDWAIRKIMERT